MSAARQTFSLSPTEPKPHDDYMCEDHLFYFNSVLVEQCSALRIQLSEMDKPAAVGGCGDGADQADVASEMYLNLTKRKAIQALITKKVKALNFIQNDEYGFCMSCGNDIGIKRLMAVPEALACIECTTRHEKIEAHHS